MTKNEKITISFLPSDSDLISFIKTKKEFGNLSDYIRTLIRNDMQSEPHSINRTNDDIIDKVLHLLKTVEVTVNKECQYPPESSTLDIEFKNAINDLF
ncbi:hypothetical protein DVB69_01265 [Sporosarcina sp. BI001-red]|uniref:hypothetical protein n=1 Tax=Sporosarcina sp. BI001-red TaxID=2282866 RepID=UPI000E254E53|nr:hypothetical protein [Sporosarcina sp. BI001-red]REB11154.1 hypothetical protein DVB69_01265 [Sporosarcina sp. BI001-red]